MLSYMLPPVLEEKPLSDSDSSEATAATAPATETAKSTVPVDKLNRTKLHLHFLVDHNEPLQAKTAAATASGSALNNNHHRDHAVIANGHHLPLSNGYGNNNSDSIVTKNPSLKRVSFGSSKGSMVETLIFDSPVQQEDDDNERRPLIDHVNNNGRMAQADNADEISDNEHEKEKVRVTFFQQIEPQSITGDLYDLIDANPESLSLCNLLASGQSGGAAVSLATTTTSSASAASSSVTTQCTNPLCPIHFPNSSSTNCLAMANKCPLTTNSMDNGWENPFRPDGELSREADQIVQMIKGGKPITPTSPIESKPFGATDLPDANNSRLLAATAAASSPNGKNGTPNRNGDMGNGKTSPTTANGNGLMKNGNSPQSKHTKSSPKSPQTIVNNDKNVQHDRIEPLQTNLERIEKQESRCRCCLLQ